MDEKYRLSLALMSRKKGDAILDSKDVVSALQRTGYQRTTIPKVLREKAIRGCDLRRREFYGKEPGIDNNALFFYGSDVLDYLKHTFGEQETLDAGFNNSMDLLNVSQKPREPFVRRTDYRPRADYSDYSSNFDNVAKILER